MIRKTIGDIPFYEFNALQPFRGGLRHAVLTRHTEFTDVTAIQKILDTPNPPFSFANQLHGISIYIIENGNSNSAQNEGDILITKTPAIPLLIRIADCASIFLFDPRKKIIANIHAGWRGLAQKVIRTAVQKLRQKFNCDPKDLIACISPMLGPCCSRFSNPHEELPKFLHQYISQKNTVDLWTIAEDQLAECGVTKNNIENPRICTFCNPKDFFSYRRDGNTGRFAAIIMLK